MSESSATDQPHSLMQKDEAGKKGGLGMAREQRASAMSEAKPDGKYEMIKPQRKSESNPSAKGSSIEPQSQSSKNRVSDKKKESSLDQRDALPLPSGKKRKRTGSKAPEKTDIQLLPRGDRKELGSSVAGSSNRGGDKKVNNKKVKKEVGGTGSGAGTRQSSKVGANSDAEGTASAVKKSEAALLIRSQTLGNNSEGISNSMQTSHLKKPRESAGAVNTSKKYGEQDSDPSRPGFGIGLASSVTKSGYEPQSYPGSADETESKGTSRDIVQHEEVKYDMAGGQDMRNPASPASITFDFLAKQADLMEASNSPFASPLMTQDSIPVTPVSKITNTTNLSSDITAFTIKPVLVLSDEEVEAGKNVPAVIAEEKIEPERQRSIIKVNHADLPDAVPLLPKQMNYVSGPPKCPMDSIKFIQLKRFQVMTNVVPHEKMNSGFEMVGNRRKLLQLRTMEKVNNNKKGEFQHGPTATTTVDNNPHGFTDHAKMDATTHFIKNIVFARDPTILDRETMHVNQRAAFSHENNLDVKKMMQKQQALFQDDTMSYRMAALQRSPMMRGPNQQQRMKPRPLDSQLYHPTDENDKTLVFESRFESGNLYLSQKVSDGEYNLLMQNDVNTQGHTQWFFFRVQNTKANHKVKFNILNYSKPDSLFNYGMKVSIYSERTAEASKIGWHKGGEDIGYFSNGIRKDVLYSSKSFYTASFTYKFKHTGDSVFFAYAQPYSYSDLRDDLTQIENDPDRGCFVTTKSLCMTLGGNSCDYLTITSKSKESHVLELCKRKSVIITGRVHPGETVGSHMMKGVLDFLTDPINPEAKLLRENFVFKVIPMLNPDGVINGNYRCSLAGCDLNRRWKNPSKLLHPTIYYTKKLVKQQHEERTVLMFCDLHGHSRKQNVFMYGCNRKENLGACRVFPFLMSKINPYFLFESSRFGVQKSKESTARVSLFKELRTVHCIYTMESSFAGVDFGKHAGLHFTAEMLGSLGRDVCRSILAYSNIFIAEELRSLPMFKRMLAPEKTGKNFSEDNLGGGKPVFNVFDGILDEFRDNADLLDQGSGNSSSGSDDMPSEDNLQVEDLAKQLPPDKTIKQEVKQKKEKKAEEEPKKKEVKKKEEVKVPPPAPKKEEPKRVEPSPPRKQTIPFVRKEEPEPKKEEPKKKPEMRDAWTQTEKSATAEYKQKLQKERQRLYAQQQQQEQYLRNPQYHTSPGTSLTSQKNAKVNPVLNTSTTPSYSQLKGGQLKQTTNPNKFFEQSMNVNSPQNGFTSYPQRSREQNASVSNSNSAANNGFLSLNGFNKRHVSNNNSYGANGAQATNIAFNSMQKAQYENRVGAAQPPQPPSRTYPAAHSDRGAQLSASGQNIIAPGSPIGGRAGQNLIMHGANNSQSDRKTNQQTFNVSHAQQALQQHQKNITSTTKSPSHFQNFVAQRSPQLMNSAGSAQSPIISASAHGANNISAFAASQQKQFQQRGQSQKGKESTESGPRRQQQPPPRSKESPKPGIAVIGSSNVAQNRIPVDGINSALTHVPAMDTRVPLEVSPQKYAKDFKEQVLQKHANQPGPKPISTQQFQIPIGAKQTSAYQSGIPTSNNRTRTYNEIQHSGKAFQSASSSQSRLNAPPYVMAKNEPNSGTCQSAASHSTDPATLLGSPGKQNYRQKPKPSPNQQRAQNIQNIRQAAQQDTQQLRSSQPAYSSKQSPQLHHVIRAGSDIKIPQAQHMTTTAMLQQSGAAAISYVNSNASISNPPGSRSHNRTQSMSNQKFRSSGVQLEQSSSRKNDSMGATLAKTTDSSTRLPHLGMRQIPKDNSSSRGNQRQMPTDSPSLQSNMQSVLQPKITNAKITCFDTQPSPMTQTQIKATDIQQRAQQDNQRVIHNVSESGTKVGKTRRTFAAEQSGQGSHGAPHQLTDRPQSSPQPPQK